MLVAVSLAVDVVTFGHRVLLVIVIIVVVVRSLVRIRPRLRSCVRVILYRYPRCCCSFARRSSVLVLAYVPARARSRKRIFLRSFLASSAAPAPAPTRLLLNMSDGERKASFYGARRKTSFQKTGLRGSVFGEVVMKEGYLKGRGVLKQWQSRYFELAGHYMSYSEKKGDDSVKGTVDLADLETIAAQGLSYSDRDELPPKD